MGKRIYVVAGEVSGDTHGAGLMRALLEMEPGCRFMGVGGAAMAAVSGEVEDWVAEAGVVGLWEVLKKYRYFKGRFDAMLAALVEEKPEALLLVDYPGFNLRFAKAAREALPGLKILYYISPQVWAWKKGRLPKMAKLLDLMICIFPFEKALYEGRGLKTVFSGHPMVDRLAEEESGGETVRERDLVGLFPGSRRNEVRRHFPVMLEAAAGLKAERAGTRMVASAATRELGEMMAGMRAEAGMGEADCRIEVGNAHALMRRCGAAAVASGTATLEATVFGLPYCLVYRVNWFTYLVGRLVVRIEFLGMANILAGRGIVRELVQGDLTRDNLKGELVRMLDDAGYRSRLEADLAETAAKLGEGGAYARAAEAVWEEIA